MLRRLTYWDKRIKFLVYLLDHSAEIEAVVSYHLGLSETGSCCLAPLNDWIHGSFNMCLPVYVKNWKSSPEKRAMIRFPLPYKVGEEDFSGNAEEKLRCEAATYIWIRENCPDVPIPQLWGFAFQDDQCVSLSNTNLDIRAPIADSFTIVHIARKPPLVCSTHGILSPAISILILLSSAMSICLPPAAVQPHAGISPYRVHRRRRGSYVVGVLGRKTAR